jgi:hypothetical protein
VRLGGRLEVFTVLWMVVEAVVSIGAGVLAGSLLRIAFGLDSVIELISGAIQLWRLAVKPEATRSSALKRRGDRCRVTSQRMIRQWQDPAVCTYACWRAHPLRRNDRK